MALRTLESPGVEIHEIDKSQYSPAMTGTKCYVMGYSDKGTPYEPMQFTSKAAWQSFYGDPDNEAERYFYNAFSEVLTQNGVLYSARLPYENRAKDKMVGFKFKVSTSTTKNPTAGQYLQDYDVKSWVDHNSNFEKKALEYVFDNKCYREIDGNVENGLENDTEIKEFYGTTIDRFNATYNQLSGFRRCSISYYKVNKEKSTEISGRFLTQKQAIQWLKEHEDNHTGHYRVYTNYSLSCTDPDPSTNVHYGESLMRDKGDWIAMPLYADYNKESVLCGSYDTSCWQQDLTYAPKMMFNTNNLIENGSSLLSGTYDKLLTSDTVETLGNTISGILGEYLEHEGEKDWNELSSIKDVQMCYNFFKGTFHTKRHEFLWDGYMLYHSEQLSNVSDEIEVPDITKKDFPPLAYKFEFTTYKDVTRFEDGADNEYMADRTVNELWDDPMLSLSATDLSDMWEKELWEPYKSQKLTQIIRQSQDKDSEFIDSFEAILSVFKRDGNIKFTDVFGESGTGTDGYDVTQTRIHDDVPYYRIADLDGKLNDYLTITQSQLPITCDLTAVDEYRTGESTVAANTFWVFDKTTATLNKVPEDSRKGKKRECIGIFPVITTVANALYAQSLIEVSDNEILDYETLSGLITKSMEVDNEGNDTAEISDCNEVLSTDVSMKLSQAWKTADDNGAIDTVSREANGYFLPIQMDSTGEGIDQENAKKIGVVVYKAYLDASEGNKISFSPVESFCGSLDKNSKNPNTGVSNFIDRIVNTQSDYIYFFSNCFVSTAAKKTYDEVADFFVCKTGKSGMLGWFSDETVEKISLTTQYQSIDRCFQKVEDINERDIDIVCDAGLANIAQYMKSIYGGKGAYAYDLAVTDEGGNPLIKTWTCKSASDTNDWKTTIFKYDNFCKRMRKDCMFICDGPRPMVLAGEKKIVRSSKPSNTIDANILPYVKYATGLNTNYGAGYLDWFQITDEFTGDEFWCPPSIKAMGVYINTDLNFNYWDAPAGLNRGVIQALDVAFSPTSKQSGPIYQKNWNYAVNYPNDGIVLEGQKTFQVKPSALDRVNVRRLMLRLERQVGKILRYVTYEGNTAYMRQRVVDLIEPYFTQAKAGGGLYDFKIVCDESNNTATTIDNNELHISIGIKPTKTIEFIICNFILLSTGASWEEM